MVCRKCIVKGRVQGVFFRASTQVQARRLQISGYARNLADGNVEVMACGTAAALDELQQWLWVGPAAAEVAAVICVDVNVDIPAGFVTA